MSGYYRNWELRELLTLFIFNKMALYLILLSLSATAWMKSSRTDGLDEVLQTVLHQCLGLQEVQIWQRRTMHCGDSLKRRLENADMFRMRTCETEFAKLLRQWLRKFWKGWTYEHGVVSCCVTTMEVCIPMLKITKNVNKLFTNRIVLLFFPC